MTPLVERTEIINMIAEAVMAGARKKLACDVAGISLRTYQRWYKGHTIHEDHRPHAKRSPPRHKLSDEERAAIVMCCQHSDYVDLPPSQIVPKLADNGIYLGSESTFYRVLKAANQSHHRGRSRPKGQVAKPTSYTAVKPNQVWSWDISYLPTTTTGLFLYLYMIVDIYSRKIVGAEVYTQESGELGAQLLQRSLWSEKCVNQGVVLHADNGSPMKSLTFQAKMQALGVIRSHSRPRVSNDNPYSEALFKTLKYCPQWPKQFESIESARVWLAQFVQHYNGYHQHSRIRFVTPNQRHCGEDIAVLQQRQHVYQKARERNPQRWSGTIRNWQPVGAVELNPEMKKSVA